MEPHPNSSTAPPPHGGNVYQVARSLGLAVADLGDFSANINPLGMPPGARPAAWDAWEELRHYPDPHCQALRAALASYHGLTPEEILVGNGSTELIYLVVQALRPRQALIITPAFSEYEHALAALKVPAVFFPTREEQNFTLTPPVDLPQADLIFLANPASPSGALLTPAELLPLVSSREEAGSYTILDEAFIDFVEEFSFKGYLRQFPRLIILRSFTKFFGMPGIRLGCLLAAPELTAKLAQVQAPWSVSTLAQAMGRACLADAAYMAESRKVIQEERNYLLGRLKALDGLSPFPSRVNYLLLKLTRPDWTASRLRQAMLEHRIIIRDASNFRGLDDRYVRVAVRRRPDNQRLLAALEACLAVNGAGVGE